MAQRRRAAVGRLLAALVLVAVVLCAREGRAVQISFEQSGGFAGLRFATKVDTEQLSREEAQKVASLLNEADFFRLPEKIVSPRPQPDRYQYLITVEGEGRCHTVMASEEAVPQRLAPLIKWLQEVVRRERSAPR